MHHIMRKSVFVVFEQFCADQLVHLQSERMIGTYFMTLAAGLCS